MCPGGSWKPLSEWEDLFTAAKLKLESVKAVGCNMHLMCFIKAWASLSVRLRKKVYIDKAILHVCRSRRSLIVQVQVIDMLHSQFFVRQMFSQVSWMCVMHVVVIVSKVVYDVVLRWPVRTALQGYHFVQKRLAHLYYLIAVQFYHCTALHGHVGVNISLLTAC